MDEAKRPIVVLHIPKTAGTSLRKLIQKNYSAKELFFVYGEESEFTTIEDLQNLSPEQKTGIKVFMGHLPYNPNLFPGMQPRYITLVRDPIERVISYYHHIMNKNKAWKDRNVSLLKYLSVSNDLQLNNHQTRVISGLHELPVSEKHFDAAIKNIENHFDFVGISEKFEESMVKLSGLFSWNFKKVNRVNVSIGKPQQDYFSDQEIQAIERLNKFDLALHDYINSQPDSILLGKNFSKLINNNPDKNFQYEQ